ncbi:ABC transporter permease [Roseococcus suduntuyensis]|uniref:Capsular polysaccharide transport system permease protein n=1 Tax=Roseococcus suduntuyensis TaxID=455361 RepID=A0A840A9L6_9PROT|nr:ABC transporter permease [Roseococcus suduntuyensis]MBB3896850.1 capsular polysaccharide transport system permease protein [Roseococcus suduntuyensis]
MALQPTIVEDRSFGRALKIQLGVLGALMMRDLHTRYGRRNVGFIWLFVEPALLGVFVAGMRVLRESMVPGGLNIIGFAVIGYVVFYAFRSIVSRAPSAAEQNEPLLWHARVTLEDVMIARTLLETGAVTMATIVFLIGIGIYFGDWPTSWVQMGIGIIMMALLGHGVALIVLALTRFGVSVVERIVHPVLYISIVFTGVFYMVWWMPYQFQRITLMLPIIHIFEFIREGQFGPGQPYHYDLGYVWIWIILLNVYGGFALRRAKPHLEV